MRKSTVPESDTERSQSPILNREVVDEEIPTLNPEPENVAEGLNDQENFDDSPIPPPSPILEEPIKSSDFSNSLISKILFNL